MPDPTLLTRARALLAQSGGHHDVGRVSDWRDCAECVFADREATRDLVRQLVARVEALERELAHFKAEDALPDETWQEELDRALERATTAEAALRGAEARGRLTPEERMWIENAKRSGCVDLLLPIIDRLTAPEQEESHA